MKLLSYRSTAFIILACLCFNAWGQTDTLRISIDECRTRALNIHEDLKKADNAVTKSILQKKDAFASYLPAIDGSAMAMYTKDIDMGDTKVLMHGLWMAGISLQQVVYAGGRIKAGNDLAKIGIEAAKVQLAKTQQDVILEVDQAYWGYVAVQQKVKMLNSYVDYINSLDQSVANSVEAEMATTADRLRISAKLSEIRYNLQKAKNGAELCRLMLCNLIGADFEQQIVPLNSEIIVNPPHDLTEDLTSLPEMQLLQLDVEAKKKQVKSAKGEFQPSIALIAGWNYLDNLKMTGVAEYQGQQVPYSQTKGEGFWHVGLSLSIPIWNWGKTARAVKVARLEATNAELNLEKNTRLLSIQARQAVQNLISGYSLVETTQLGLKQASENLRIMQEKFDANYCTLTDLLDAQSQWHQAESNLIEAKTQYMISESEYYRAVGTLNHN